jgi:ubiquinone/menaquinone biosynthesis C-methylase UbiE
MIYRFQAQQLGNPNSFFGRIFASVWNRRNKALNDLAFANLELQPDDRVLEVGFGGGYLMSRMASGLTHGFLAGVDISQAMVTAAKKRFRQQLAAGNFDLQCARAESLPFDAESFNKACSVNSIFYWENTSDALAEFWRVLRYPGKIILCQTDPKSLEGRGFASHVARYEAQDICRLLETTGFEDVHIIQTADRYREFSCLSAVKLTSV